MFQIFSSIIDGDFYSWVEAIDADIIKCWRFGLPLPVVVFGNFCGFDAIFDRGKGVVFISDLIIWVVDAESQMIASKIALGDECLESC